MTEPKVRSADSHSQPLTGTERAVIRKSEAGQAMALTAVALVVLLGFTGLAVDMGVLRYDQRLQQTAADAAAIAGAKELRYDSSGVVAAGQNAASANGFALSGGTNDDLVSTCDNRQNPPSVYTVCVQINNPPKSGPHDGDSNYVEALVSEVHPTYFMRIFGIPSEPVTTRAVATLVGQSGAYPGCIYTLGPPGTGIGVTSSGTPTVNAPNCGIYDAGDWTTNGAAVNITAAGIGVSGSGTNNGGGTVTCTDTTDYSCPETGLLPQTDPLAYLQEPNYVPTSGTATTFDPSNPVAGTYSSIDISGGTVNFAPGTYVVDGNFTINGNSYVTGTGVTFYITNGGAVSINGTSTVQLSAPDSGTYAGVLFYQDPSDTSLAKILGTNDSWYQGALYFPSAQLEFGGTNTTCTGSTDPTCSTSTVYNSGAEYTNIVADNLKFFGTATIDISSNYSALPGGVGIIKNAILVE